MTVIQTYDDRPTIRTDADALDMIRREARRSGHSAADLAAVAYSVLAARDAGYGPLPPLTAEPNSTARHFALVVVIEADEDEQATDIASELLSEEESVIYVGEACDLGESEGGTYSTSLVCLGTGDQRGVLLAMPYRFPICAR